MMKLTADQLLDLIRRGVHAEQYNVLDEPYKAWYVKMKDPSIAIGDASLEQALEKIVRYIEERK